MYDKGSEFVVIGVVAGELTAQAIKASLESINIPAVLGIESIGRVYGMLSPGMGDVRIMVPRRHIDDALRFLGRTSGFSPDPCIWDEMDYEDEPEPAGIPVVIHPAAEPFMTAVYQDELTDLREVLSCTTCKFDRESDFEKGRPWCHTPEPPVIVEKYCHAFEVKETGDSII